MTAPPSQPPDNPGAEPAAAEDWLQQLARDYAKGDPDGEAAQDVIGLAAGGHWDHLWRLCVVAIEELSEQDDEALAVVAAGALEDLVRYRGAEYAERIVAEARRSAKFRRALTGVWARDEHPDLWRALAPLLEGVERPL